MLFVYLFDPTLFYEHAFNLLVSTSGRFLYFYVLRAASWRASPSCFATCFSACRLNASAASKEYFPKVGLFIWKASISCGLAVSAGLAQLFVPMSTSCRERYFQRINYWAACTVCRTGTADFWLWALFFFTLSLSFRTWCPGGSGGEIILKQSDCRLFPFFYLPVFTLKCCNNACNV